jgi:hypothetical protein
LSNQTDGSTSTYFTSLPDGTVISESVSGSTYYYLSDGTGSVAGLMDSTGALKNQYSYDPLGNITSSSGTVSNPFTFQGGIYDSSTGFYNTGSGYYDPATGQAFGCRDKGWWDPGEDLCGEDETRGSSGEGSVAAVDPSGLLCRAYQPELTGRGRTRGWKVEGFCLGDVGTKGVITVKLYWERQEGKQWSKPVIMGACLNVDVIAGGTFNCTGKKYHFRRGGTYQLCVALGSPQPHVSTPIDYGCGPKKFRIK